MIPGWQLVQQRMTWGSNMEKTDFQRAMEPLIESEGTRYENHPKDPGGPTKYGVTIADVKRFIDPHATADTVRNLTYEQAEQVYRMHYWTPMHCDELAWPVNFLLFDMGVNAGPSRSIKIAQHALGVDADGVLGPITLAALQAADVPSFVRDFSEGRRRFYRSLRTFPTFGRGWLARVDRSERLALELDRGKMTKVVKAKSAKALRPDQHPVSKQGAMAQVAGKTAAAGSGLVLLDGATGLTDIVTNSLNQLSLWQELSTNAKALGGWAVTNWRTVAVISLVVVGWYLYKKGKVLVQQGYEAYMSHARDI